VDRWGKGFFREGVFWPGEPEMEAAAVAEARFLWRALKLKRGARVLDVACGTGRHARRLARRGALVTGVDATQAYLDSIPPTHGLALRRADMRRLPFRAAFDAAYNVWTSFGYFEKPADDLRALRSIRAALKPGGLFVIDVQDFDFGRETPPRNWGALPDGGRRLEETRVREGRDPALLCRWTIARPDGATESAEFFVRGYDEARLRALLVKAGFEPLKRWRALDGRARGPRLVLLARRK
jgi:SAM-dependent methyltransferase